MEKSLEEQKDIFKENNSHYCICFIAIMGFWRLLILVFLFRGQSYRAHIPFWNILKCLLSSNLLYTNLLYIFSFLITKWYIQFHYNQLYLQYIK